jgi:hypothetical protein
MSDGEHLGTLVYDCAVQDACLPSPTVVPPDPSPPMNQRADEHIHRNMLPIIHVDDSEPDGPVHGANTGNNSHRFSDTGAEQSERGEVWEWDDYKVRARDALFIYFIFLICLQPFHCNQLVNQIIPTLPAQKIIDLPAAHTNV